MIELCICSLFRGPRNNQSINQIVINQSINQSIRMIELCICSLFRGPRNNQSINQIVINQSINQSIRMIELCICLLWNNYIHNIMELICHSYVIWFSFLRFESGASLKCFIFSFRPYNCWIWNSLLSNHDILQANLLIQYIIKKRIVISSCVLHLRGIWPWNIQFIIYEKIKMIYKEHTDVTHSELVTYLKESELWKGGFL